ncbi:MAG: sulfatase [Verrucomicrobia bacterium]|nr:sulfatase [Verrucomicrobiota bacterium]MDA1069007.1 sulfatase [Verrucomicrobiota bacterium]
MGHHQQIRLEGVGAVLTAIGKSIGSLTSLLLHFFSGLLLIHLFLGHLSARPNILLILSDDHSVPHLGSYGTTDAVTPHLDQFASEGVRFDRAYTTAPQCAPSRASIFTGRSPVALGITRFTQPAPRRFPFFTDVLRENGYYVGLTGRYHHLRGRSSGHPDVMAQLEESGLLYIDERFDHAVIQRTRGEEGLEAVPKLLEDFLDEVPDETPFFLYFGFTQTHRTWIGNVTDVDFDAATLKLPFRFPDVPEVREDYRKFLLSLYDLDRGFGMLMDVLEKRGLKEDTLVIFMGDNGEPLLRGKGTLYEAGCNVPLLVRYPGVAKGGTISDVLISGEDLSATILEAVGLPVPESMTGVSFLPALKGDAYVERDYVFTERSAHGSSLPTTTQHLDLSRAVTTRDHVLIYNALYKLPYAPVDMDGKSAWEGVKKAYNAGKLDPVHEQMYFSQPRPMFELYDLNQDPNQIHNLAGTKAFQSLENDLRIKLTKWMVREADYLPLPLPQKK